MQNVCFLGQNGVVVDTTNTTLRSSIWHDKGFFNLTAQPRGFRIDGILYEHGKIFTGNTSLVLTDIENKCLTAMQGISLKCAFAEMYHIIF